MGRLLVEGPDRVTFLQHVLSSNVMALDLNQAQYCIIPEEDGGAVDDAYLYRFEEDRFLLVVNAANTDKDLAHLNKVIAGLRLLHHQHHPRLRRHCRPGPQVQGAAHDPLRR